MKKQSDNFADADSSGSREGRGEKLKKSRIEYSTTVTTLREVNMILSYQNLKVTKIK